MAPSQGFRALLAQAERGDIQAQAFVSGCYYHGDEGVTRDLALAFKFCRMAAYGGDITSQMSLAEHHSEGEGVERDERKASAWLLRVSKEGAHGSSSAEAQCQTAVRYQQGLGYDAPNMKESIKWYQAAVAQGHAGAQLHLSFYYDRGDGVPKNPGLALKLWRKCAQHHELGDAKGYEYAVAAAHHMIGNSNFVGSNGLVVDLSVAMQWWTKAAEQGDIISQCTVVESSLMGFSELAPVGTFDRDVPRGMKNLRAAIDQKSEAGGAAYAPAISKAEALIRAFHAAKSCLGCGRAKTRKLCGGCVDAGQAKARYCGKDCQLVHWHHPTASHKAKCGSRAATRAGGSGAA
jgi:TPR repeat protein